MDGRFEVGSRWSAVDSSLYLVAGSGGPASQARRLVTIPHRAIDRGW